MSQNNANPSVGIGRKKSKSKSKSMSKPKLRPQTLKANVDATKIALTRCNEPELRHPSTSERMSKSHWRLADKRDFPNFIKTFANDVRSSPRQHALPVWSKTSGKYLKMTPYKHQQFVSDYMSSHTPYRGLLLYHGLGSGKTGASITIAEGYVGRQVVVMLPASLRQNYEDEIKNSFGDIAYRKMYHWCFVPLDLNKSNSQQVLDLLEAKGLPESLVQKIVTYKAGRKYAVGKPVQIRKKGASEVEYGIVTELVDRESIVVASLDDPSSVQTVKKKRVKHADGIWMIDVSQEPNYDTLSTEDQRDINQQIDIMYNHKYTFLHYNAPNFFTQIFQQLIPNHFQRIKLELFQEEVPDADMTVRQKKQVLNFMYNPANNIPNPFHDKVVIVDEVHNITSKMTGKGVYFPLLYEILLRSQSKLIFLSGTPAINSPYELGLMFNMLRGFTVSYKIPVSNKWKDDELATLLRDLKLVNRFQLHRQEKTIEVVRHQYGFVSEYDSEGKTIGVKRDLDNAITDEEFLLQVQSHMENKDYLLNLEEVQQFEYKMFPDDLVQRDNETSYSSQFNLKGEQLFNEKYIDDKQFVIKKRATTDFKKKIVGLVSHFNEKSGIDAETQSNIFPSVQYEHCLVELSDYQYRAYLDMRRIEIDHDKKRLRRASMNREVQSAVLNSSSSSYFRVLSRQVGIFVFPPNLQEYRRKLKHGQRQTLEDRRVTEKEYVTDKSSVLFNPEGSPNKDALIEAFAESIANSSENALVEEVSTVNGLTPEEARAQLTDPAKVSEASQILDSYGVQAAARQSPTNIQELLESLNQENLRPSGRSFFHLQRLSPKFCKLLDNLTSTEGLALIYSQFKQVEGIALLGKVLLANGYRLLHIRKRGKGARAAFKVEPSDRKLKPGDKVRYCTNLNDADPTRRGTTWITGEVAEVLPDTQECRLTNDSVYPQQRLHPAYFAQWVGGVSVEERKAILDYFNQHDNRYGIHCLFLLITSAGAEGISLFNVRQVHILEPYWNLVRRDQVVGRARRIKSHIYLRRDQQNVTVYDYSVTFSNTQRKGIGGYYSTLKSIVQDYLPPEDENVQLVQVPIGDIGSLIQSVETIASTNFSNIVESITTKNGEYKDLLSIVVEQLQKTIVRLRRTIPQVSLSKVEQQGEPKTRDIHKKFMSQVQLFNDKSQAILKEDENLTSDEVLTSIAEKKSSILQGFLTAMKSAAVDCNFNKDANVLSNPEYEGVECFDIIQRDHTDSEFNFRLESADIMTMPVDVEENSIERMEYTIKLIRNTYRQGQLSFLVKIPSELQQYTIKEYMTVHNGGALDLFNYYWYYNIDPEHPTQLFQFEKVGVLFPDGRTDIRPEFLQKVRHFFRIQECVNKSPSAPTQRQELEDWRQEILKCVKEESEDDLYETDIEDDEQNDASNNLINTVQMNSESAPAGEINTPVDAAESEPETESQSEYTEEETWV